MADEPTAPTVADATKSVEEVNISDDAVAAPAVAEATPAEGGSIATEGVAEVPKIDDAQEETAAKDEGAADAKPDSEPAGDDAAASSSAAPATNGTPAAKKTNNGKRKSGAGVPEHKKKTPAKSKKKAELRLNAQPGEMYMVAMRGYQPWPVIVCDEEMLPESLLSKRPVSAKRIDGTYREDFLEGGKNAKDRRYPVMFLGTNEFAWQMNTELLAFDIEDVKREVDSGNQGKKNKALWEAYQTAAEDRDLAYFKQMLHQHEAAMQDDLQVREQKVNDKKDKADKAAKRKSTAAVDSDDVDMEDAGDGAVSSAKKAKASKKRKKEEESDGESEKPAKAKLKLTTKAPKDASAAKPKKETKTKKKSSEEAESAPPEEPPMTEEDRLQKREKQILYLRHRLQKGFLSRDQAPKDEDMANMSDYLKQLEAHADLEADIMKKTKVHKVLKAIVKLNSIPQEEEFNFKLRSSELLVKWNTALAAEPEGAVGTTPATEAATNGVKHEEEEKTSEPAKEGSPVDKEDNVDKDATPNEPVPAPPAAEPKVADLDGDVSMADADKEVIKDAPAVITEAESAEDATKAPTNETAVAANEVSS